MHVPPVQGTALLIPPTFGVFSRLAITLLAPQLHHNNLHILQQGAIIAIINLPPSFWDESSLSFVLGMLKPPSSSNVVTQTVACSFLASLTSWDKSFLGGCALRIMWVVHYSSILSTWCIKLLILLLYSTYDRVHCCNADVHNICMMVMGDLATAILCKL